MTEMTSRPNGWLTAKMKTKCVAFVSNEDLQLIGSFHCFNSLLVW